MSKEEKDLVVDKETTDSLQKTDNSKSFFGRIKQQVKTFNLKNSETPTNDIINKNSEIDEKTLEKELRLKEEEVRLKEQELKKQAKELEKARKKFEEEQRKIAETRKKNELARAEKERLEKERIAREKELERERIEKEKAEKREKERLERERIAREKELERQRIEKEHAEKRKREYRRKEKEFQLLEDKKKIEFLKKENEIREHENILLSLQNSLLSLEDKIEEKKLTLSTLKNRRDDKEKIILEEKRLNGLTSQKQILLRDIMSEKKIIEKIQKNLEIEHKLDGLKKEIHSIKKEVVNEDETAFKIKYIDNKIKNIFLVSMLYLKAFVNKNIFRKNVKNYDQINNISKNIKVKIATSVILAALLSVCFLITLKFISSSKEHYVSFGETNTTAVDTTEEMKKQKEAEEKAKILAAQEKAEAARIDSDAQDEEITAKLAGTFTSYSFDVNREVTVSKKIHAFKSASWADQGDVIESGTKLTVNKLVSPAGYLMYQISSGKLQGQFITANEKFVTVNSKNDQLGDFISRPVAIKFLATQNVYSDESVSKVRVTFGNGAQLNINGIGITNNRLIYYVTDGSFVPVNPVRVIEVNRETPKSKNIDNNNNNNSQNNQRTTS